MLRKGSHPQIKLVLVEVVVELADLVFASEESSAQINRQRSESTLSGGTCYGGYGVAKASISEETLGLPDHAHASEGFAFI